MSKVAKSTQRYSPIWVMPALGWFLWFLLVPLLILFTYSFSTKGTYGGVVFQFSWENYTRAADWIYFKIFWNSLKLASTTAFFCLLLGYPMAFVMATSSKKVRSFLLLLVIIPFWTNFVVRAYATKIFLGDFGPLSGFLMSMGLIHEPLGLVNTEFSVALGMVTNYLPFMVLPLYVALEKFDFTLIDAAKDLGASSGRILWEILFPLTRSGIVTGVIFVFTPALGEFVIPSLLGGARSMLIGNLITEQFLRTRDWPFGSALSFIMIAIVMVSFFFYLRTEKKAAS